MQLDSTDRLALMFSKDSSPAPTSSESTTPALSSVLIVEDGDTPSNGRGVLSSGMLSVVRPVADSGNSPVNKRYAIDEIPAVIAAGRKYDSGKEPLARGFWAYFGKAARGVAAISAYGVAKYKVAYADQNWRIVDNAKGRYADALLRHFEAHLRGEILDPESGKPHIDHMAWNALALSELEKQ